MAFFDQMPKGSLNNIDPNDLAAQAASLGISLPELIAMKRQGKDPGMARAETSPSYPTDKSMMGRRPQSAEEQIGVLNPAIKAMDPNAVREGEGRMYRPPGSVDTGPDNLYGEQKSPYEEAMIRRMQEAETQKPDEYALMKAMDPNSAVRGGEMTPQTYPNWKANVQGKPEVNALIDDLNRYQPPQQGRSPQSVPDPMNRPPGSMDTGAGSLYGKPNKSLYEQEMLRKIQEAETQKLAKDFSRNAVGQANAMNPPIMPRSRVSSYDEDIGALSSAMGGFKPSKPKKKASTRDVERLLYGR
jgi:hypothetical protein